MVDDLVKQAREVADSCKLSTEHMWLVSTMADRIEKLEAALRLIAQHDYGLQGMIEDDIDTPENKVKYYAGQVNRRRHIARKALEGKDD